MKRTYVIDLIFDQIVAPTFKGEVSTQINFMTDQSKTVTSAPIVEGTFAPATQKHVVSEELKPLGNVVLFTNATDSN